jgi:glycosyltransferase involved in cell wall biosynthesis
MILRNKMKILLSTGIYPPKIGGPAQYALNLGESLQKRGCRISLATYTVEDKIPFGLRHIFYFLKVLPRVWSSDISISLDTFSVAFPTVLAAKVSGKRSIIRTGGDFLWENYVESHRKKVLLRDFYSTEKKLLSLKEKLIFLITKWTLHNTTHIVFSTEWQRDIFIEAYGLEIGNTSIIENYYGPKERDKEPNGKVFIASSRGIFLKNEDALREAFIGVEAELFTGRLPYGQFIEKIASSYAVVAPALSEISPNLILDAIRYNRPFICTKEVGIHDRIKEAGTFVNPLDVQEIKDAVLWLLTEEGYREAKEKVKGFSFVHTWQDIAEEFLKIINKGE